MLAIAEDLLHVQLFDGTEHALWIYELLLRKQFPEGRRGSRGWGRVVGCFSIVFILAVACDIWKADAITVRIPFRRVMDFSEGLARTSWRVCDFGEGGSPLVAALSEPFFFWEIR